LAVLMTLDDKPFKFYGAFASIGVYGLPQVKAPQYSSSLIWLENSMDKHQFNILSAGWSVEPSLYGDSQTRLTTAWTNDGFHGTGCHDVVCPGFVQVSSEIPVGTPIGPLSILHGQQYAVDTYIYLDQPTKNWWLILGKDKKAIGYWPTNIFTTLSQYATQLQFGGVVGYSGTDRPPMGSGLPAELGAGSACYFKRVQYVNEQNQLLDLKPSDTFEHETFPRCYEIGNYVETRDVERNMFYFGGDGHC
ncbi:Neprosin domain-containing protein, partial [Dioscorea alata]